MPAARTGSLHTVMAFAVSVLVVAGAAVAATAAGGTAVGGTAVGGTAVGGTAVGGTAVGGTAVGGDRPPRAVTVRDAEGQLLAQVPLRGERFAVSYRNSIYGTLAEERYAVSGVDRFALVELAADQLAVLEEYYALPGPPRHAAEGDRRGWRAGPHPDRPAVFSSLSIAATTLGERTLLVPDQPPLPLWQLVTDDNPTVVLDISAVLETEESP